MEEINKKFMEEYSYTEEDNLNNGENTNNRFIVDDLSKADWCFKKIRELEEEKIKVNNYVEIEKSKYDDFLKKENERIESSINHFTILIQNFVDEEITKNPKFKLKTVNGFASYGKLQNKFEFNDEEMIEYCKNNNLHNLIEVKEVIKLNKKDFKNYLDITEDNQVVTKDGEILDNVIVNSFKNFNLKTQKNDII